MKGGRMVAAAILELIAPAAIGRPERAATARTPAAQPRAAPDELSPLVRATIFVRDQRRSLALYRDLLGMRVFFDHYWDNGGINAIMATRGETLRAVVLGSGDEVFGKLGIYQLDAASVAKAPPPATAATTRTGDFALVFRVRDLDMLFGRLKAGGYPIVSPPTVLRSDPGKTRQQREMMFRDPDGVLVNLIEPALPAK